MNSKISGNFKFLTDEMFRIKKILIAKLCCLNDAPVDLIDYLKDDFSKKNKKGLCNNDIIEESD